MAIINSISIGENTLLLVWDITESVEILSNLTKNIQDIGTLTPKNNLHWLASRAILASHFGKDAIIVISKNKFNKPSMTVNGEDYNLSITHSGQYAAILFSKFRMVALDIEKLDSRIDRVTHKFINNAETEMLESSKNSTHDKTLIWSAKETLYKFYGEKELDFKQHMTIFINNPMQLRGCLHKHTPHFYELHATLFNNYVLTYLVE
ncbi:MAG: 4'-phosphopantetheinyl transferase superfamily protein [Bacteroidia bacterium]|nr:4'-phosphopantetheinyl transferase superfamily protein [Bacteroidia bacterium]